MTNAKDMTLQSLGHRYAATTTDETDAVLVRAGFDLAVWELDCATGFASRNANLLRLLRATGGQSEVPLDEFLNQHIHPGDLHMVKAALAKALTSQDPLPVRIFHRILSTDREVRLVEMRVQAYFQGEGKDRKPTRLASVLYEVTDLVAEARLGENHVTFRTLADTMPQMVWSTLPDGHYDYFNARWYAFTGMRVGTTDGNIWNAMFHPDDRQRAWDTWNHSLQTGQPYEIEYRLRRHDEQYRWTLGRAMPIRDENGTITRWFGTCTDIHDQRQAAEVLSRSRVELERLVEERSARLIREAEGRRIAEEALRRSEKLQAIGLLTGGTAHDINNVLQVVVSGISLLKHGEPPADKKERILGQMTRSVETAQHLIGRMLSQARVTTPATRNLVDLESWVANLSTLLGQTLGNHIRIETDFPADLDRIGVDVSQLEAAVLNIAVNARDAMPEGGTLRLSAQNVRLEKVATREAGDFVALTFSDTGSGMTPEVLAQAFAPFFTTKGVGQGTGLGLSQIYGFVKEAGGEVELTSTPGLGTSLKLVLPKA